MQVVKVETTLFILNVFCARLVETRLDANVTWHVIERRSMPVNLSIVHKSAMTTPTFAAVRYQVFSIAVEPEAFLWLIGTINALQAEMLSSECNSANALRLLPVHCLPNDKLFRI